MTMLYRIVNHLVAIPVEHYLISSTTKLEVRHDHHFFLCTFLAFIVELIVGDKSLWEAMKKTN